MKQTIIFLLFLLPSSISTADSVRQIAVTYRDAQVVAQQLQALFKEEITVIVEANNLLIRGDIADVQAADTMIQEMDKPQRSIHLSLYRGVDPYGSDGDSDKRRIVTTNLHRDNRLDQWIMEDGATMVIRDNIRVLSQQEQAFIETDNQNQKALFVAKSSEQTIRVNQHDLRVILLDSGQSARLDIKTHIANRAAQNTNNELISTEVHSRRIIATGEWTRLFYRQNQANSFSPDIRMTATTRLNFADEQTLWILVEPLEDQ